MENYDSVAKQTKTKDKVLLRVLALHVVQILLSNLVLQG